jgi:hypothetical protein
MDEDEMDEEGLALPPRSEDRWRIGEDHSRIGARRVQISWRLEAST